MSGPRFYLTDHVFEDLIIEQDLIAAAGGSLAFDPGATNPEQWLSGAVTAIAVVTCHAVLPADFIERLQECRVIARYGVGIDNVDLRAATKAGIPVTHVPDYCVDEVSTHAMALLLALNRGVARLDRSTRAGNWSVQAAGDVHRIRGQILGLVGFGRNARAVAEKAQAFGLVVLAYDPFLSSDVVAASGVLPVGLDELLERSDYVSLHAQLSEQTHHLVNTPNLERMKSSAYLINTARGGLVDIDALRGALENGAIAGAALDVFETEPPGEALDLENVIVTPHSAFASVESVVELKRLTILRALEGLDGERPAVLANPEVWDRRRRS